MSFPFSICLGTAHNIRQIWMRSNPQVLRVAYGNATMQSESREFCSIPTMSITSFTVYAIIYYNRPDILCVEKRVKNKINISKHPR